MKKDITIFAEPRGERGKNEARRLRVSGRIPAVVYGAAEGATPISIDPREIDKILYSDTGHNTIFNIEVAGLGACPAMIVDWQHDPIRDSLLHVDLKRIDLSRQITVKVPVHPEGEPRGVKQQGGLFEVVHREVEIECLPANIPPHIAVDVTPLMMGQNLRASDLPLGEGIALKSSGDLVICHVVALRVTEAAPEAAAPAAEAAEAKPAEKEEKEKEKKKKE
jgi:large subunit ribosomal protein L25